MILDAERIVGRDEQPDLILLAFEDATQRKFAERHREMLIAELSHRVKNSLAVVQSLASQTLRGSATLGEFGEAFTGRIQALGRAHDIALASGFQRIALGAIIERALEPFRADGRVTVTGGPPVEFDPVASQSLTLMMHELATNALKYGALSTTAGTVSIGWHLDTSDGAARIALTWIETGGPPVTTPERQGQGTRFITRGVRHELRGEATLDFRPEGLHATIAFPIPAGEVPNAIR